MMKRHFPRWCFSATVLALLGSLVVHPSPAMAVEGSRADAGLAWLAGELAARSGMLTVTFGDDEYADPGLTIDAILAEVAGGHRDDPAVAEAVAAVDAETFNYVNQFSLYPADRAANATAKALLLQGVLGTDLGDTVDLEPELRALMATVGDEIGRFNDTDLQGYGNYSNGLGQALALLALDRTSGGVPPEAVSFLLDQQCSDGGFRLYYFGYVTSYDPFETENSLTCTDPATADVDASALALQALLAVPATPATEAAAASAVEFLLAAQQPSGGYLGDGAVNANSTGLAAQALRAAGATQAADVAAAFVASLQSAECVEFGAIAYDAVAFSVGVDADRDQWIRASAQGVMGLGLASYGGIGSVGPVSAGLAAFTCPEVVVVPPPTVTVSSPSVVAGGEVTLRAAGFDGNEPVDITLYSDPIFLGSVVADAAGAVSTTVSIPADLEPGAHRIELVGRVSGRAASVSVEVLADGADAGVTLPATGRPTGSEVGVALLLLLVGAALVGSRRRLESPDGRG